MARKMDLHDLNFDSINNKPNESSPKVRITKPKDLLSAFEMICEHSKDSRLDASLYKRLSRPINYVSEVLGVNANQSLLLALFVENSDDRCIYLNQFAQHLKCSTIKLLKLSADLDDLEKRRLIRCSRADRRNTYRIPKEVVDAFSRNETYVYKRLEKLDFWGLFNCLSALFEERDDNELTYESLIEEIDEVLSDNSELDFVKVVNSLRLATDEKVLLIFYCHKYVNEQDECIISSDYEGIFDSVVARNCIRAMLTNGEHILVENGWIDYVNNNGVADRSQTCLSAKAKRELFVGVALRNNEVKSSSLLNCNEIKEKKMFYTCEVNNQIKRLTSLLMPKEFKAVCNRLSDKGLRQGFATLFYGGPGTGKTETVYQIAKTTGRDIMCVDISSIKSCWVGESEKNIKAVFDRYRQLVEKSEITPILLFNEADAIIGKRSENAERSVDKMENSIQNIILQEIENLEGILIATTNLSQNLDKAFERRFIYKIKFERPDNNAKRLIWKSMMPDIVDDVAEKLASMYDFSGGQIENVSRKYLVDCVLNGDIEPKDQYQVLSNYCMEEKIVNTIKPVGFGR